jgi:uncharacterized membrane protein YeaQ/YmgE (transglycosylase-associated protein family)
MNLLGFLVLLFIAAVCGAVAQAIVGYSVGGCLLSSIVGVIGALLGYWLARQLSLPLVLTLNIQGQQFPIIWSIIGASLFVGVLAFLRRGH